MKKKILSILLIVVMVISILPVSAVTTFADFDEWGVCNSCGNRRPLCDQCETCYSCTITYGIHCGNCDSCFYEVDKCEDYDEAIGALCIECCTEDGNHCEVCEGHVSEGLWCENAGEGTHCLVCVSDNDGFYCTDCNEMVCFLCDDEAGCVDCETCYSCIEFEYGVVDCPGCGDCINCMGGHGAFCVNCYTCEYCAEICSFCGEYCDECAVLCDDCGQCEYCVNICEECGEVCDECVAFCEDCNRCGNCVMLCDECEEICNECAEFCDDCDRCEYCVDLCDDCGDYCSESLPTCIDCGRCIDCTGDICENCWSYCDECFVFCSICGFCENCCEHGITSKTYIFKPGYDPEDDEYGVIGMEYKINVPEMILSNIASGSMLVLYDEFADPDSADFTEIARFSLDNLGKYVTLTSDVAITKTYCFGIMNKNTGKIEYSDDFTILWREHLDITTPEPQVNESVESALEKYADLTTYNDEIKYGTNEFYYMKSSKKDAAIEDLVYYRDYHYLEEGYYIWAKIDVVFNSDEIYIDREHMYITVNGMPIDPKYVREYNQDTGGVSVYYCFGKLKKIVTNVPVTEISLSSSTYTVRTPKPTDLANHNYGTIRAIITPENASNKKVIYTSSNEKVVSVSTYNGNWCKLNPHIYGKATITARTEDGNLIATCEVQTRFYDVLESNVSASTFKTVYWGTDNGYVSGYDGGVYFAPEKEVTRAEMAVFLYRLAGRPAVSSTTTAFSDVNKDTVSAGALKAISWAVEAGITRGYSDGTFKPEGLCTRAEMAVFLYRLAGKPAVSTDAASAFSDMNGLSSGVLKAIGWAVEAGIAKGYSDGTFAPAASCTRANTVTFMYRFKKKY